LVGVAEWMRQKIALPVFVLPALLVSWELVWMVSGHPPLKQTNQKNLQVISDTLNLTLHNGLPAAPNAQASQNLSIELPAGSRLDGEAALADLSCDGRLGECRFTTGAGHIQLDEAGPLHLTTGAGRVTVGRAHGRTEITGSGQLRVREIEGPAVLKNLNGATWVGLVTGDLRCNSANGDISVDRALAAVEAKTANGDVRVGEVVRGSIELGTSYGQLEIGIREGTAALLDVASKFGSVRNSLTVSEGPGTSDLTVQVRARTSFGDIVIRRSTASSVEVEKQ